MTPSEFALKYIPIKVYTRTGWKYAHVQRYVSGEPRKKKYVKEAHWDLECFVKKQMRYKESKGNFTGTHHLYDKVFVAAELFPPWAMISWHDLNLCFYGKGSPSTFASALRVVDYYLTHANIDLSYVEWNKVMPVEEYAYWYFGLDCNGFTGAYYAEQFPSVGIDGGDDLNGLDSKKTLSKREDVSALKTGDILVRKGSRDDDDSHRHVVLIENVAKYAPDEAFALVVHSSWSRKGLSMEPMMIKKLPGTKGDNYGKFHWRLAGYLDFHCAIGPK